MTREKANADQSIQITRDTLTYSEGKLNGDGQWFIKSSLEEKYLWDSLFERNLEYNGFELIANVQTVGALKATIFARRANLTLKVPEIYESFDFFVEINRRFIVKIHGLPDFLEFSRMYLQHAMLSNIESQLSEIHNSIGSVADQVASVAAGVWKDEQ